LLLGRSGGDRAGRSFEAEDCGGRREGRRSGCDAQLIDGFAELGELGGRFSLRALELVEAIGRLV